jgi:hypothetical protein
MVALEQLETRGQEFPSETGTTTDTRRQVISKNYKINKKIH